MSFVFTANNMVAANVRRKDILFAVEGGFLTLEMRFQQSFSGDIRWLELSLMHQNKDTVFGSKGETAMHRAAKKSNYQFIQKLLDNGFSPLAVGTGFVNYDSFFAKNISKSL